MTEISELQEDIYGNVFRFPGMTKEDKILKEMGDNNSSPISPSAIKD
jgi:hypothetical protein